jgi:hypothetical protein
LLATVAIPAHAQTIATEIDLTAGYSSEEISGAAAQARIFGEAPGRVGFFAELTWGDRWAGDAPVQNGGIFGMDPMGSDVFGAAYPYADRPLLMEAYAERHFTPRGAVLGVRAGRFRTPFGIYTRSDYGYTGFLRPPLIRYDGYYALSNNWLEEGVTVTAGRPELFVEASLSRPHDVGSSQRRAGTDGTIRAQAYHGPLIVGVSHMRSNPYLPSYFAVGRQAFTGIDLRWAHARGVQTRSEIIRGRSFEGVTTTGWYVDGLLHLRSMGPVSGVTRVESLDYDAAAPFARSARRFTVGTRIRMPGPITVQVNYLRQRGDLPHIKKQSIDFSATYSVRVDH